MTTFTGTAGDDTLKGTQAGDDFHLEQGGDDIAKGGGGDDSFYLGGAFNAQDSIIGGAGIDHLILDGDYSAGLAFSHSSAKGVEFIDLMGGNDYSLDSLNKVTGELTIDGSGLGLNDVLRADASRRAEGITILGGQSSDVLTGGNGGDLIDGGKGRDVIDAGDGDNTISGGKQADRIVVGDGVQSIDGGDSNDNIVFKGGFQADDRVEGGAGFDQLLLKGAASGALAFQADTVHGVEQILVEADGYDITLNDANVAAGGSMSIIGAFGASIAVDGSQETDGHLILGSGDGNDILIGGAAGDSLHSEGGDDLLSGGAGDDLIAVGGGHDTVKGGLGADTIHAGGETQILYTDVADSTGAASDRILELSNTDVIDLGAIDADTTVAGDQAFHLVASLSGVAGELALTLDPGSGDTTLQGDVDGDGTADLVIVLNHDHTDFTNFVL